MSKNITYSRSEIAYQIAETLDEVGATIAVDSTSYDIEKIVDTITIPTKTGWELRPEFADSLDTLGDDSKADAFWNIVGQCDISADLAAAEEARDEEFHQLVLSHAQRSHHLELFPLVIGDVTLTLPNSFRKGGFTVWPTSEHFWGQIDTPHETLTFDTSLGSWGALRAAITQAQEDFEASVKESLEISRTLKNHTYAKLREAEIALEEARQEHAEAVAAWQKNQERHDELAGRTGGRDK
ncbi:hypothetical protein [Lysinibacter sp. HNR]|uniref:hypothetical protein n=1 Tax=Lysinibacter sp. HNR TaxID=3031408 RepID=UPI002434A71D|nr:hypothetical protein [Lysinibacter sp. HNR]WGD38463.1 hypothetical protein FrondiHNR_06020 [Lysinibacter sp. HNR]